MSKFACVECGVDCIVHAHFHTSFELGSNQQVTLGPFCPACWAKQPTSMKSIRIINGEAAAVYTGPPQGKPADG